MLARTILISIAFTVGCGDDRESGTSALTDAALGSSGTSTTDESSASSTQVGDSTGATGEASSDGPSTGDDSGAVDTTGGPRWVVSGVATRSAELSAGSDGIGNVDIGLFVVPCAPGLTKADEAAVYRIENVDMTAADVEIPFALDPAVPPGTYWVGGVFDDNANLADTPEHQADTGDLVATVCPMVVVRDADVPDVELVFDFAIP